MARLLFGLGIVGAIFTVYALADCVFIARERIRGAPRALWVILILVLPVVGAIMWFLVGRGRGTQKTPKRRIIPPDDDPEFLGTLGGGRKDKDS
jgi:hypothetical protein